MRTRTHGVATMIILAVLAAPALAEGPDAERLSGEWVGTTTSKATGDCPFGDDPQPLKMRWTVDSGGKVTVDEVKQGKFPLPEKWSGVVTADGQVTLTKTRGMKCFGEKFTLSVEYSGRIEARDGALHLSMAADENWCPKQNCTARVRYDLSH